MRKALFSFLLLCLCYYGKAQFSLPAFNYVPQAPTTAAFTGYGEIPVDMSTGVTGISHEMADNKLNTYIDNAFAGVNTTLVGKLYDGIMDEDDDLKVSFEVEIVSVDKEVKEPAESAVGTSQTGTSASTTNSKTSGITGDISSTLSTDGKNSVSSKLPVNESVTLGSTGGALSNNSVSTGMGIYKVTYRIKVNVFYDSDSYGLGLSTGNNHTFLDYSEELISYPLKGLLKK